jgi:hypothetical protein
VDGLARHLQVDAGVGRQQHPQLCASAHDAVGHGAAQLAQERAKRDLRGGRGIVRPQRVDQLVAPAGRRASTRCPSNSRASGPQSRILACVTNVGPT